MKRILTCALLLASGVVYAQDDTVTRAMRDEMQRSMTTLQLENLEKPYFISYKITETDQRSTASILGNIISSEENKTRRLTVVVRVGDYHLDNSNYMSRLFSGTAVIQMFAGTALLPLEDDYQELRRQIWLATDSAYKKALEDLSSKKADLENRNQTENIPDFSKTEPTKTVETTAPVEISRQEAEALTRTTSAIFRQLPLIQTSRVQLTAVNETEHYLNSEGTYYLRQAPEIILRATASTQAKDGMEMNDSIAEYGRTTKDLPPVPVLSKEISNMAQELITLREASGPRQYNGPVLFEDQAAAYLFARHFASLLAAQPQIRSANSALSQILAGGIGNMVAPGLGGQTPLLNKIGSRVFPDFLSLTDDPTLKDFEQHALLGGYKVDEEGIPAHPTLLVKDGILKTLLTSRSPVRGILKSSGNMRGHGIAPSNLILESSKSVTPEELKTQLIDLIKTRNLDYGVIVHRLDGNSVVSASLVYPDGHETPMRNLFLSELTYRSFKDVVAVSDHRTVYTEPARSRTSALLFGQGFDPEDALVSYVVPSMIVDDISIERPTREHPKPPILSSPLNGN